MEVTTTEALELIYKHTPKKSTKILPIEQALGYILSEDIKATHNLPPYDNSAMDGYAVKISDASKCVKVTDTIFAGDNSDAVLEDGCAIKIMTGAKIPEGSEAIVPKEDTTECENGVKLPDELCEGKHIRRCGEDIKCCDLLLSKGVKLQAHQITLLASQGISHIKVYKQIRVAIFASGSELKMHFESVVDSYQLYNTNAPALKARCEELGCKVDFIGTAKDSVDDLKEHLKSALDSDLIITSGGVSVGDADHTKEVFDGFGMHTHFDKIQIKPGKPTTFGCIEDTMVLNLPGNPMAASLNFELFGQSILLAMSGANEKFLNTIDAQMADECKLRAGRRTLLPGYYNGTTFTPTKNFAPGMIKPLSNANSYIVISEECSGISAGSTVKILPIRFSFNTDTKKELISC
ncbi:gephyrin-like molybdotransferase Glp [Sulfurimonas sp.]|uniref:molybdopterin molybdotransferase MoeA n=1 Tax=Sulfurimonas sp. TaxID=2022749 RepID=UPI003565ADE1